MTNGDKLKTVVPWADSAERISVHHRDEQGLTTSVTGWNQELADWSVQACELHKYQMASHYGYRDDVVVVPTLDLDLNVRFYCSSPLRC